MSGYWNKAIIIVFSLLLGEPSIPKSRLVSIMLPFISLFHNFSHTLLFITASFHSFCFTASSGFKLVQLVVLIFLPLLESSCSSSCFSLILESMESSIDYMPLFSEGSNFFLPP
jgi:hypothetical protein